MDWRAKLDWTPPRYKKQMESDLAYFAVAREVQDSQDSQLSPGPSFTPPLCPTALGQLFDKESQEKRKKSDKRITAIRAYFALVDPSDAHTIAQLETQLRSELSTIRS